MKKVSRNFHRIFMQMIALLLFSAISYAQTTVTGKVTDSKDGSPVVGATVMVKGTKTATTTSNDGSYKISAPANAVLTFTSIGFVLQEVNIGGRSSVNVSFEKLSQQLTDVVVVAYGTRRKTDLTGAVTQITTKDFQKGNINSSEQLLQGKVAGLQITSGGGSAGGGSRLRIRGGASLNASNDPLIVIDGVPVESNGISGNGNLLNTINPNDIESMSVLKDASATALYGSRASNGVIIVTTKKGAKGKIKYNYNSQANLSQVVKTVDVLTGDEIRSIINADAAKPGGNTTFSKLLGTANTDWQSLIFQKALGWDNNISASGAIANTIPFRLSVGYLTQEGILITDKFNRLTSSLNLSPKFFKDHLSVNVNLKASQTKNRFADGGAVGAAASFDPTQSVYANNVYGGYFEWLQADGKPIGTNGGSSQPNPLSLLYFRNNKATVNRFIGNVQLDYKLHFFPDLHVLVNLAKDHAYGNGDDIRDAKLVSEFQASTKGRFSHYAQFKDNSLLETSLFYTKDVKAIKGKIDVLAGHTYQGFSTDEYNYASYSSTGVLIAGSTPTFETNKPENRLESYLGRINLTANNKYLLTASLRRDASSKFAKENRVGYFPSVAAGWKLKEEFFTTTSWLNELKLRLGWGITGQQDGIGNYNYLPVYSQSNSAAQYQFGGVFYGYLRPGAYDPDLRWETTTTQNLGLDFAFFKNRVSGSVEVYKKQTKDLLSTVPVAAGANFNIELLTNVGNIENKGIEFTLNTTPVKTTKFSWDFGFNVTYNNSEVTNLLKNQDPNFKGIAVGGISGGTGNNLERHMVGFAPYTFFVYKQVYDQATGNPIEGLYEDLNRDGIINESDRYLYKKAAPDLLYGINTQVTYGPFSLGLAAHGTIGNYMYNNYYSNAGVLRAMKNPLNFVSNVSTNYLESRFANNQYISDYYIENASFLRLDNINLGYNVGKVFNNKASLRVAGSVQNVLVVTNYKGLDPENSGDAQIDNNIYPRPRVYSLGFNLDF